MTRLPADAADSRHLRVHSEADRNAHYADLVEQLFREYESVLSLSGIVALVNQCRHELAGIPPGAMPELLERLARCRLSTLAAEQAVQTTPFEQ